MAKLRTLSEADEAILRQMVQDYRNRRGNTQNRPNVPDKPPQAPEVYVVRTPMDGIPGLFVGVDGAVVVGGADCERYRKNRNTGLLENVGTLRDVSNLSCDSVPGFTFGVAVRDKFGVWYITEIGCVTGSVGTGTALPDCNSCIGSATLPDNVCATISITPEGTGCSICFVVSSGVTMDRTLGVLGRECLYRYCTPLESSACINYLGAATAYDCLEFYYDNIDISPTFGKWVLQMYVYGDPGLRSAVYTADSWDCSSPLTLTKFSDPTTTDDACGDFGTTITWPSTATILPGSCSSIGTGTGSDFGGGVVWLDTFTESGVIPGLLDDHTPDLSPGSNGYLTTSGEWSVIATSDIAQSSIGPNTFVFDPGVTDNVQVQFDFIIDSSAEGDNFNITWVTPNSLQVGVTRDADLDTWLLSVSDTGSSDTVGITIQDGQTYTIIITCTPTSVSVTLSGATVQITPVAGDNSVSTIQVSMTTAGATMTLDNLIVLG